MSTIEEIQARREARRKAVLDAKQTRFARDLERLDALEEEHGYERVLRIDLPGWDASIGGPTMVVMRVPRYSEAILKAFEQEINRSKDGSPARLKAQQTFARACMAYPHPTQDAEDYAAVLDTAPGVLAQGALLVLRRAQGVAAEEGKD